MERWYIDTITRDMNIERALIARGRTFWFDYVQTGEEPPPDGSKAAARALLGLHPRSDKPIVKATGDVEEHAVVLRDAVREAARAKANVRAAQNQIKAAIGDNAGIDTTIGVVTWKANKGGSRVFRAPRAWRNGEEEDNG